MLEMLFTRISLYSELTTLAYREHNHHIRMNRKKILRLSKLKETKKNEETNKSVVGKLKTTFKKVKIRTQRQGCVLQVQANQRHELTFSV